MESNRPKKAVLYCTCHFLVSNPLPVSTPSPLPPVYLPHPHDKAYIHSILNPLPLQPCPPRPVPSPLVKKRLSIFPPFSSCPNPPGTQRPNAPPRTRPCLLTSFVEDDADAFSAGGAAAGAGGSFTGGAGHMSCNEKRGREGRSIPIADECATSHRTVNWIALASGKLSCMERHRTSSYHAHETMPTRAVSGSAGGGGGGKTSRVKVG